jgi:hypothetical protein
MTPDCPRPRTHAIARWPPPPAVFDFLRTSCFQICGCLARLLSCTHAIAHWPLTATVLDSLGVSCFSTPGLPLNQRGAPTCSNATPQAFPRGQPVRPPLRLRAYRRRTMKDLTCARTCVRPAGDRTQQHTGLTRFSITGPYWARPCVRCSTDSAVGLIANGT